MDPIPASSQVFSTPSPTSPLSASLGRKEFRRKGLWAKPGSVLSQSASASRKMEQYAIVHPKTKVASRADQAGEAQRGTLCGGRLEPGEPSRHPATTCGLQESCTVFQSCGLLFMSGGPWNLEQ